MHLDPKYKEMLTAWDNASIPSGIALFGQGSNIENSAEGKKIRSWLSGKKYNQISDSLSFLTESPLFYLSQEAANYYIGGYLESILTNLVECGKVLFDYPEISLRSYLASEKFRLNISSLDYSRQNGLLWLVKLYLTSSFVDGVESTPEDIDNLEKSRDILSLAVSDKTGQ